MAGLAKPTIGISSSNVISRSGAGGLRSVVLEDNFPLFLAEMDKQSVAALDKAADPVVSAAKVASSARVKTGEMRRSIKKGRAMRLRNDSVAVMVVVEDFKGLFHEEGTLGNYKDKKLSKSHKDHLARAASRSRGTVTTTRRGKAKVLRATYKRSTGYTTKTGKERTKKHGLKPLRFLKKGLKTGWNGGAVFMREMSS